ncbi:Aminotransferase, plant mobile domain family protein [Trifolium repens]|nr:Aminotransferase, plant mobile domain family protein [Trifolium repens]
MSTKKPNTFCIYDSRIATLISPNSEKPVSTQTLTNFLKPCSKNTTTLIHSQTLSQINHHFPKIHFKGWKNPQTKWGHWVEKLTAEQAFTWNKTGICDALLSSLYHFPHNPSLILALVQYWSPKTNTFVFPWGEATITLEDVMILGGFSVLGESVHFLFLLICFQ